MRVHFLHRHVHDTVVMLEEGNLLLSRCPRCDLQVPQEGAQWAPPGDLAVSEGGGAEAETAGRDGDVGKSRSGVPRLWETDGGGVGDPLPRAATHGNR